MKRNGFDSRGTAASNPGILLADTARATDIALLAIDLAKAGNKVSAVCSNHHPLLKTRAVAQKFPYSGLRPLQSLAAAIKATNPQIIVPCDERAVEHLHELHAQARSLGSAGTDMAALIEKSLGPPESYPIVSSRYQLLRIARQENLRVPEMALINSAADLKFWQARQGSPCVLKADGTTNGSGVRIADTPSQAGRFLRELNQFYTAGRAVKRLCVNRDAFWLRPWWKADRPSVIVQSFIRGHAAHCAAVCWKGTVLASIGVEVVSATGPTSHASVVKVVENPEMRLAAERIAHRLGLSGFFGLDFMIEEESGLTFLIEMNPRPIRLCHIQLGKGRDLVGALCAQLTGRPIRQLPPVTQKEMIAYFPETVDCERNLIESTYQDIPEGEPDLVREILKPWPPRGLLWHAANLMDRMKTFRRGSDSKRGPEKSRRLNPAIMTSSHNVCQSPKTVCAEALAVESAPKRG